MERQKSPNLTVVRRLVFDSGAEYRSVPVFTTEKPFALIRKTDHYHLLNHTLSQEDTLSHIVKQQIYLGRKQRDDLDSQAILYFHIIYGFLALNREFQHLDCDMLQQIRTLYFLLYLPIIKKLNVICCGSKELRNYRHGLETELRGGKPLLTFIRKEPPSIICHHCDGLCHYDDDCCRIVYCRGCQNVYCYSCTKEKKMMECELCKAIYCPSHMIQRNICHFCMHPKTQENALLFGHAKGIDVYCRHIEHLTQRNSYDRLFCCCYCNVLTCIDHYCSDANLCIMCLFDIVNKLIRVKPHFWTEKIKNWVKTKQLVRVSKELRVVGEINLNSRLDSFKSYKVEPSFNLYEFLVDSSVQQNELNISIQTDRNKREKEKGKKKRGRTPAK